MIAKQLFIGPSTGWMYAIGVNSLRQQQIVLENAGANAVEFCMGGTLDISDIRVNSLLCGDRLGLTTNDDTYRKSIHLPDYQPDADLKFQARAAREIAAKQAAFTMVIHPLKYEGEYPVRYYEQLNPTDWTGMRIRLAIENMDKRKPDGFLLSELEHLTQSYDLGFVLDVQHAFEHDSSMAYAKDLFGAMRSNLAHLHVSGESEDSNHCLLHRARNATTIVNFLGEIFSKIFSDEISASNNAPIILEGEYQNASDLRAEIEFIKRELGF